MWVDQVYLKKVFAWVLCCGFALLPGVSNASIAIVDLYASPDVKIAFVTNYMNAHCKLMRSDFTESLYSARIKAAVVDKGLADKWVMLISNSMNADSPSCLLR